MCADGLKNHHSEAKFSALFQFCKWLEGFPNHFFCDLWVVGFGGPTMLTTMTEEDWTIVLKVFEASRSRRGDHGRNDRKVLEALQYFVVHNITWRALPEKFGHWNSIWKRFWRLSRSGTFEAFFDALAAMSETAHLVQMFDSTIVRAHVSAAGAKGGSMVRRSVARVAASRPRFT
jgi:transposase